MLVPFAWMILTAFKTTTEATQMNPFVIFPKKWKVDAFVSVTQAMDFTKLYLNTLLMIFWRIVCAVVTACMAGYAFGRLHFRGRNICFALVLFQMMVPSQIFIIPQYLIQQGGASEYHLLPCISGTRYRFWNLSYAAGVYGSSKGFGGSGAA